MDNRQKKQMKTKKIGYRTGGLVAGILAISIITVVFVCVSIFNGLMQKIMTQECVTGTNVLAYELERYTGEEDKTQFLDQLKEMTGCEFTIFRGDERVYTTIQQDGKRVVGTKLSPELSEIVLKQGQSYVGESEILGKAHLCSYVPTKDASGNIDGLIFSGISRAEMTAELHGSILTAWLIGMGWIVAGIVLVSVFLGRKVSRPLAKLTKVAQNMEQGNLGLAEDGRVELQIRSKDEIGFLAQVFEDTIARMKGYIGEIATILQEVAGGNLTVKTAQEYVGDFTSIQNSLENILGQLNSTMSQITESSVQVSASSEQLSTAAQALSIGVEEQANAVEELVNTFGDISTHVTQTAGDAEQASQTADMVGCKAIESNQKMQEMTAAMTKISSSSNEIGKIIKAIEDIAFQTNILALNAAVEAARAGEAGKGFAVVAEEVRSLATKTSEASQNTTALIGRSIAEVEHGTQLANETAVQLEEVVTGVSEIVETIERIADASKTQVTAVSQVQEQITQISNVVQTNAATAEESAAASEELSRQAELLKELIEKFRLS